MSENFLREDDLPIANVTRKDFYDLVQQLKPLNAVCDDSDTTTDQTIAISNNLFQVNMNIPRWRKYTIGHSALTGATANETEILFAMGSAGIIHAVRIKHSVLFDDGASAASAVTVSVGTVASKGLFQVDFDILQAVSATAHKHTTIEHSDAATTVPGTDVIAYFQATGALCNELLTGSVDIWVLYSECY